MKKIIFYCFIVLVASCNNNNSTNKNASPAASQTNGNYFTCKLDGKDWQADEINGGYSMGFLALNGYGKENDYITLPLDSAAVAANKTFKIDKSKIFQIVGYGVTNPLATYLATDYEIHFSKLTSTIAEGTFSLTAYSDATKKTIQATDGKFSIQLGK